MGIQLQKLHIGYLKIGHPHDCTPITWQMGAWRTNYDQEFCYRLSLSLLLLTSLESSHLFPALKFSLIFLCPHQVHYYRLFEINGANYSLNDGKFLIKVITSDFVSYPQVDKLVGLLTLIF